MSESSPVEFSVDTGLFRQLGELLVGRDSTALSELIKNAYDADATVLTLYAENLQSEKNSIISVADNGIGMTADQFRRGFLRLAATGKAQGDRRSPIYRRRYTGEKGVGRLAAHKLAAKLDVISVASTDDGGRALPEILRERNPDISADEMLKLLNAAQRTIVQAMIDWDAIEEADTLSDIRTGLLLDLDRTDRSTERGTSLELTRLRHTWSSRDLTDLARQLTGFEPPTTLTEATALEHRPVPLALQAPQGPRRNAK